MAAGQVVQITINVTDGNAAEAVQQVVAQLNAIGPAAAVSGAAAGAGLDQVGEHALSSRENVRLLSEEMGIRVPRAMQSVIANSQMMMGAIGAIGPAMIAFGGADILYHIGEGAYKLYENFVELKGVISDSETVIKSFGDSAEESFKHASQEYVQFLRITQGSKAADQQSLADIQNQGIKIPQYQTEEFKRLPDQIKGSIESITGESILPKDIDPAIVKMKAYRDAAQEALDTIRAAKSGVVLGGQYSVPQLQQMTMDQEAIKAGAAALNDLEGMKKNFDNTIQTKQAQIGKDKPGTEDQQQAITKEKEKQDAIFGLQNAARNSEMAGIALLESQREQALDTFKRKYGTSRAAIDAIDTEYNDKEMALWNQQWEEADKAMRTAQQAAQQAAHTGSGGIENDRQNLLADINQKRNSGFDPTAASKLEEAANLTSNAKILSAQTEFDRQMEQVGTHADDAQVAGYARIADEANKSKQKIQEDWQALADKVGADSTVARNAWGTALSAMLNVDENATREMEQLHQKTMQQITKEEEQAARMTLPEWQQSEMAIKDAFDDRVRAYKDGEDQQLAATRNNASAQLLITQTYNQQVAAADAVKQAQLQKNSAETRDKLATGLQSLFSNPAQFFEKRAMDTAFQMMATDMMSYFKSDSMGGGMMQWLFGMGPQMSMSTNPGDQLSSIFHGSHGTAGGSSMMLNNAGTVLSNAGTLQMTAAQALLTGSTALESAASTLAFGSGTAGLGSMANGGFGMLGSTGSSSFGTGTALSLGGGGGSYTTAAGNSVIDASSLGAAGSGESSSLTAATSGAAGLGTAGKYAGAAGGALTAGLGIYSAYENSDPLSGAISGAMGGAAVGSLFGPEGTVIGAMVGGVAGLLAGIFGDKGAGKAKDYDKNTVQPEIAKDIQDYESGRSGYNSAAKAIDDLLVSAQSQTAEWGSGARSYYYSHIKPEVDVANSSLAKQEIGGRSAVTMSAAQYHTGGWVGDFGDLATGPNEGWAKLLAEEYVVQPMAARSHGPLLSAINAGNVSYSNSVQPRMPASSGSGASVNLTIQAIDSQSVAQWAKAGGGRALVSAINQAQRQYSGVGRG